MIPPEYVRPLAIVNAFLARLTYKPGFQFMAHHASRRDAIEVTINHSPQDSGNPSKTLPIVSQILICSEALTQTQESAEEIMRVMLFPAIRDLELHEMHEWLKIDGKHVKDPHPELKST